MYKKAMIKIISTLISHRTDGSKERHLIELLTFEKEVSDFIDNHKQQNFKIEWKQSISLHGKLLFIVITAIISPT